MKKFLVLAVSFVLVMGMGVGSAFALSAGTYDLNIIPTPTVTFTASVPYLGTISGTQSSYGVDGDYESSFSFGKTPGDGSQIMPDGTSDGWAGVINITVDGSGNVSVNSFQKDSIPGTAGGTFSQGGTITGIGSTSGTSLDLNVTGRLGSVANFPLSNLPWNIDDFGGVDSVGCKVSSGNTLYGGMGTGTASAVLMPGSPPTPTPTTINGTPIWTDSTGTYAVLVSGGHVGSSWGGFWGASYFETWRVKIEETTVIPEPGSLLLIGSGLIGLIGLGRKRMKK